MRKILLAIFLIGSLGAAAQEKLNPPIKVGSKLAYSLSVDGQTMPFIASVDSISADYVKLGWAIEGLGTGAWIMKKKSLESATFGHWNSPAPGEEEVIPDHTTVLILSKAQWKALSTNKKFDYSGTIFSVKTEGATPVKVGGKVVDAIQVASPDGVTQFWILNNANFPALLKVEGNPYGVNVEISYIE